MTLPKTPILSLLIALCVAANPPAIHAQESEVDQLIKEFKGEEKAKERTPQVLEAAYMKVVEALLPKMGSEDPNEQKGPQQDLQAICWRASRPGAEVARAAVCKAIAAKLGPDTPKATKVWLLLQLERVGRAEAVASVTAMLEDKDPEIRDCARRALEGNPSPKAAAGLRAALDRAGTPEWRAALINALGYRNDNANTEALMKYAASDDDAVRCAAIAALARLGDKAAADVIASAMTKGSKRAQAVAADSYLLLADALCRSGDKRAALAMYRKLLSAKGHLKCAAIVGIAQAGGAAELPTILKALADKDTKVRGSAMAALQAMPGSDVTRALAKKVKGASPETKAMLLRLLARRGDKSVLPTMVAAAKDTSEDVRIAAYEGMGDLADGGASETLVAALVKSKDREQAAAAAALSRLPGEGVVDVIIKGLSEADATGRVELVKTLAARKSGKVMPTLLRTAQDGDVSVRIESLRALAGLAEEKDLPTLVGLLTQASEGKEQKEAEKAVAAACQRVQREDRGVEPVIKVLRGSSTPRVTRSMIRVLGMVGGATALEGVKPWLKAEQAETQDAAVRALADWPDAASASALLDVARNSQNQTHRVLALRGYVRVVGLPSDRPISQTLKMLEDGMAAAQRPEDKKLVLAGLAEVKDLGAFKLVKPLLSDDALRAEAMTGMIKIAEPVSIQHRAEAEAELKAIADTFKDEAVQQQIKAAFQRIAQYDDYITAWMLSGPYTQGRKREKQLFDVEFPPEKPDAKNVKWQPISGGTDRSKAWKVELDKIDGVKGNNRVAYLQAWIRSDKEQKARLEMGSDDGLKAWLNGQVVDSQNVNRGLAPGQDKVEVTLKKGWNSLLLKVTQGGSFWAACARVRAADGRPLPSVLLMGDPKALEVVAADLGNEELKAQAAEILLKMARAMMISYPNETKSVLKKVAAETKDAALRKQIASVLGEGGSFEDCITTWQVSGPYFEEGANVTALFDKVFPPEKPDHGGAKWSTLPKGPESRPGLISLDKALGGNDRAAYVRTYVSSPKKQDALLEVGSDDGVKVWLNGKVVHANNVARPLRPCEDTVKVTLEQGWNSVLMKVTQGGGEWQACARLRDANDKRIDGLKFQTEPPPGVKFVPVPEKAAAGAKRAIFDKGDPIGDLLVKGKLKEALALAEKTQAALPQGAAEKAALDMRIQQIKDALAKKEKEDRIKEAAALLADIPKITAAMPEKPRVAPAKPRKLLVYSEAHGFRHTACAWGAKTFEIMGKKTGAFEPVVTDDMSMFEPDKLQEFDAVCLNNTTGDIFLPKNFASLPKDQQEAARKKEAELQKSLTDFVASGKGFIGIHAATDANYKWAEYGKMLGAYFWGHPWNEKVGIKIDDPKHPLCAAFGGKNFEITDEIYQFKEPYSRDTLRVLLSIDTSTTNMNKGDKIRRKDNDFAVSWVKSYGKGRVFYCSLGHRNEIFSNPMVLQHYLDGIQFALGDLPADATPSTKLGK